MLQCMSLCSTDCLNMDWTWWALPNKQNIAIWHSIPSKIMLQNWGLILMLFFVYSLTIAMVEASFRFVRGTHIKERMFPANFRKPLETMPWFSVPSWHHCCMLSVYHLYPEPEDPALLYLVSELQKPWRGKSALFLVFKLLSLEIICYPTIGKECITLKH